MSKNEYYKHKKNYPKKRQSNKYNYPKKHQKTPNIFGDFFKGNLANGMKFGGDNHDLSGFVKREVCIKDQNGNVQKAKETQFFNSGSHIGRVKIHDDDDGESNF